MATDTFSGSDGEIVGTATPLGLGISSTTATYLALPPRARDVTLTPRNFSGATVMQVSLCPWVAALKVESGSVTQDGTNAQLDDTGGDFDMANTGTGAQGYYVYLGSHIKFGGAYITFDSVNNNASVLSVSYYDDGGGWGAISGLVDGTDDAGASFGQDGDVTWTAPSDWMKTSLIQAGAVTTTQSFTGNKFYWVRFYFSAALDGMVDLNCFTALPDLTSGGRAEFLAGQSYSSGIFFGPGGYAGFQLLTDAGTGQVVPVFGSRGNF